MKSKTRRQAEFRIEHDSLGEMRVPTDKYWGAQTQRAVENFNIGADRFRWGRPVIRALGVAKACAAQVNARLGELDRAQARCIAAAAREVAAGKFDAHFPLAAFQTGSGTQTNMNANEVIARRANALARRGARKIKPIHPNDHVNRGQSSNDVFPAVMHIAVVEEIAGKLLPAAERLRDALARKAQSFVDIVMIGRTHLQDAVPVTLGQVFGGWAAQVADASAGVRAALDGLYPLALGGTAVGTGLNSHPRFAAAVAREIARATGRPFVTAPDKFAALAAHDALVQASGSLRTLAVALFKIANDVRLYASGPRAGIGELVLPANEPGSSIMPGKVNPTQCEALTMVAAQVIGNDATVAFAGTQGHFQLNVFKPVILHNVLESATLLAEACASFERHCVAGIRPDRRRIAANVASSLMLVTALNPHIGYEDAAKISLHAWRKGLTLRQAALDLGLVTATQYDRWVRPERMLGPRRGR